MRLSLSLGAVLPGLLAGLGAGLVVALIVVSVGDEDEADPSGETLDAAVEAVVEPILEALVADFDRSVEEAVAAALADQEGMAGSVIATAVAKVLPGVVIIDAEEALERDEFGNLVAPTSLATGLILDESGFVLTNEHVIRDAVLITVILADGRRLAAELVSTDAPFNDLAVLRITETGALNLVTPPYGSSGALQLGETVVSVGNPLLGDRASVTVGVVSDPDTSFPRENSIQEHLIQTDAALNQGNSGGALVNLAGEIVGLTTTVVRMTDAGDFVDGVGFALQIDVVLPIARAIMRDGFFPRADFGVVEERTVSPIAAAQLGLPVEAGAFLLEITQRGALADAGLRPGDIILRLNGVTIDETMPYTNVVARLAPEEPVVVDFISPNGAQTVTVIPEVRRR
jgi:S1-C subfamily serine protease